MGWRFEQNIVQAAAALGCGFAKDEERKISLSQCSQTSCSSKLIGESFTCNNQNKEETCTELENLHLDVQDRINTQCKNVLRRRECHVKCDNCILEKEKFPLLDIDLDDKDCFQNTCEPYPQDSTQETRCTVCCENLLDRSMLQVNRVSYCENLCGLSCEM